MKKFLLAMIAVLAAMQLAAQDAAYERVFIELDENVPIEELVNQGVRLECVFGNTVTASVPKSQIGKIRAKSVTAPRRFQLYNDAARQLTGVDLLHSAEDRPEGYTGKGILVGMIDCGIDFTHPAFRDADGNCRIRRAYLPADNTERGHEVVIDGNTLPGREFITPEEILAVGYDSDSEFHGTHTSATAAGSFMGNRYYGMAPEAELVVCAMPAAQLTNLNIANSIKYIINYAREAGMPVAINMSIGDLAGPHDGTSEVCRVIDELSGAGNIVVISSGNSGDAKAYIEKNLDQKGDVLRTFLDDFAVKSGGISAWHDGKAPAAMRFVLVDKATSDVLYRSDVLSKDLTKVTGDTLKLKDLLDTAALGIEGNVIVTVTKSEYNGKFNLILETSLEKCEKTFFGIELEADPGTFLRAWNIPGMNFSSYGIEGYTDGLFRSNENDLISGKKSIGVGAYKSRDHITREDGEIINITHDELYDIAYFSSFGPDANGVDQPMVVAPGYKVVSAFNSFSKVGADKWVCVEEVDDKSYMWAYDGGTSMSAPVVTGTMALWLEAKPDLTPEEAIYALQQSSVRDEFVERAPNKWGFGKLDAVAGMKVVKELAGISDSFIDTDDPFKVEAAAITVLGAAPVRIYTVSGQLVATYAAPGTYTTAALAPGIYIVKSSASARKIVL